MIRERLYNLLPAIYRVRDAEQQHALRGLLAVIEQELTRIEQDIGRLYEDCFIETCSDRVVPYIAAIVGVPGVSAEGLDLRAFVANSIAYRRRKGTVPVLENVAHHMSGWPAHVVEYFDLVGITQILDHPRLDRGRTVDLRNRAALARLGAPFDSLAHRPDVRNIRHGRGRFNVRNIGIHLWPCEAFPLDRADLGKVDGVRGAFTFHPFGVDSPLRNHVQGRPSVAAPAEESGIPYALKRSLLRSGHDLKAAGVLIFVRGAEVSADRVVVSDLSGWAPARPAIPEPVFVDPELGRLLMSRNLAAGAVQASYAFGSPARIGGGPYDRHAALDEQRARWEAIAGGDSMEFTASVSKAATVSERDSNSFKDLSSALAAWQSGKPRHGVIQILDSCTYQAPDAAVRIDGRHLVIEAAAGARPALKGSLRVFARRDASLRLNGIWLEDTLEVRSTSLLLLDASHCTLFGGVAAKEQVAGAGRFQINVFSSICGPLRFGAGANLEIQDSIIDSRGLGISVEGPAIGDSAGGGPAVSLARSTVFGSIASRELIAADGIITGSVDARNRLAGGTRFTFFGKSPEPPLRRYRCQPEFSLGRGEIAPERLFRSLRYGDPGYARLGPACPIEVSRGAENGSEMGCFQRLSQPQRSAQLQLALRDFMPAGLEAGIFHED